MTALGGIDSRRGGTSLACRVSGSAVTTRSAAATAFAAFLGEKPSSSARAKPRDSAVAPTHTETPESRRFSA